MGTVENVYYRECCDDMVLPNGAGQFICPSCNKPVKGEDKFMPIEEFHKLVMGEK